MRGRLAAPESLSVLRVALLLGVIHAVVDGSCAALLVRLNLLPSLAGESVWLLYLVYSVLAFGTQAAIGMGADRSGSDRNLALGGVLLTAVGIALAFRPLTPWVAVAAAGLGNAAFHVGAGAIVLRMSSDRSAAAGVLVAPGAIGLAAGKWCGTVWAGWPWLSLGLLVAAGVALMPVRESLPCEPSSPRASADRAQRGPIAMLALFALLLATAIRSAVGFEVSGEHTGVPTLLWCLVLAAAAGKAAGGFVSDRLGWTRTSVLALLAAAPLLSFGGSHGLAVVVGTVLLQMTMPVTLLAVYRVFPDEPGLSFGLPSLALLIGGLPALCGAANWIPQPTPLCGLILLSAACLAAGLPPILRERHPA